MAVRVWPCVAESGDDPYTGLGSGCPVCAGKAVEPGFNDLAHGFPEVAAQWDTEKNNGLTPEQVTLFSNRVVWWRCGRGHSYRAGPMWGPAQQWQQLSLLRWEKGAGRL